MNLQGLEFRGATPLPQQQQQQQNNGREFRAYLEDLWYRIV